MTGQIAPPANCIGTVGTLTPGAVTVTGMRNTAIAGYAKLFDLTYWRAACTGDPSKSAVLVRVSNMIGGKVFFCGANFKTMRGGMTWDTTLLMTSGTRYSSWCNDIHADQTFTLDQWSHKDRCDSQAAFGANYDFIFHDPTTANVPASSGGSSTPTTPGSPVAGTRYNGWWYNASQGGRGRGLEDMLQVLLP